MITCISLELDKKCTYCIYNKYNAKNFSCEIGNYKIILKSDMIYISTLSNVKINNYFINNIRHNIFYELAIKHYFPQYLHIIQKIKLLS